MEMEMEDSSSSSSPAADFVDYLGPDTSATVFNLLHHPADLARASAVSRSWRQFVIDNQFSKLQCLRACPEVSTFTTVDVTTTSSSRTPAPRDQDQDTAAWPSAANRDHKVYMHLGHGLLSPYKPRDCIIHCIGASSTDNFPEETIENTLEPVDHVESTRPSYWSSGGQRDPAVPECLIYRLQADLCLIDEIKVQPFKAFFQHGDPIYSAKSIRIQMGYPRSPLRPEALVCDENEGQLIDDRNYVWTYTSPEFPMLQENVLQSFKLPRPILCIGGVVKVELLGRVQKQAIDGLYYICISHVQIVGKALSRDLGVVPRGNGLVLNYYYLDPRTCGVPRSESSVLVSAPVGPRPVYDSDVEVCEPEIPTDYAILLERLTVFEKENDILKEKLKRTEEEKMKLELHVADMVDDHKIKMDAMRLKIRKIRKYAIDKEAWYYYVVGSIVTLVAILIAFVVTFKCFT